MSRPLLDRRTVLLGAGTAALAGACGRVRPRPTRKRTAHVVRLEVNLDRRTGPFRRLSGAQGSPLPEVAGDVDHRQGFLDVGLANARFPQDCEPNALTLGGIFPDENADPSLPQSYHFGAIDPHVAAARLAGAAVLWQASYDVGRSDRWVGMNLGGRAPENLARWSRVVTGCLDHFNDRWAGGLLRGVRHVEFLNEPDGLGGFGRNGEALATAFETFLRTIATYNQAHADFPVTAVGPGVPFSWAEWSDFRPRIEGLLKRLASKGLALPVFSFHTYGRDTSPVGNERLARALRDVLDANGFKSTPLWNTEWQGTDHVRRMLQSERTSTGALTGEEGRTFSSALATYALCCKVRWQGLLEGAYYYRANARAFPKTFQAPAANQGHAMYFSPSGRTQPLGLHEKLLARVAARTVERVEIERDDEDGEDAVLATVSGDDRAAALLLCNETTEPRRFDVHLYGGAAAALKQASLVELGPSTTDLEALPGVPLLDVAGAWGLSLEVPPLSSSLVELAAA